ncbi:hypothetical protein NL438_25895, partial [Klebsiella pneumoniae]|nr:hypothetical protein [Klebsiella pneumoniae]
STWPWLSCDPPRYDMISGALFFLALTLHRLTTSVDPTDIYHNIRCPHRLRGPQGVSEASGLKHTPFCAHIEKKRP